MNKKRMDIIINAALDDLDAVAPDINQMLRDLRQMRLSFRNKSGDISQILQDKKQLIRQMWKLGKIHELLQKGLLSGDGTLTKEAFDYLEDQRQGKLPVTFFPGEIQIEFSIIDLEKAKKDKKEKN